MDIKPIMSGFRLEIHAPASTDEEWEQWGRMPYDSHEEAELACLRKLIEIANQSKQLFPEH